MSTPDPAARDGTQAKQLRFDPYLLDLERGCLLLHENEIALRPKTFSVLCYPVRNSQRLVSKDELFGAVWPNVAVTDDTLVQSISELRQAIGDEGARLIRTVPRRGYRFEAEVTEVTPAVASEQATGPEPNSAGVPLARSDHPNVLADVPAATKRSRLINGMLAASGLLLAILITYALWSINASSWHRQADSPPSQTTERPAIAILPFLNQDNDSSREYFADGLTQDLITALGRFPELTVMSWNAVSAYRRASATPGEIARSLGVRYQVEGSVLQAGD